MTDEQPEQRKLSALGRTIRQIRSERGISLQQLARASMVEAATIEAVEAGQLDPEFDLLLALSDGLGIKSATLVTRAEQEQLGPA